MIARLKAWLAARRGAAAARRFEQGFDFAAGILLRGQTKNTAASFVSDELEDVMDNSAFFDSDDFDDGMQAAVRAWREQFGTTAPLTWPPIPSTR